LFFVVNGQHTKADWFTSGEGCVGKPCGGCRRHIFKVGCAASNNDSQGHHAVSTGSEGGLGRYRELEGARDVNHVITAADGV
jgi:hypothetical protein